MTVRSGSTPLTNPDGVIDPAEAQTVGWRSSIRSKPGIGQLYRLVVFLLGLVFILGGFALAVLPGPLTIPPVVFGLWLWSTEFAWAQRLFQNMSRKGRQAWAQAKERPVVSAAVTVGGLTVAGAAIWAVGHYQLVERARDAIGI
jgi:hypothetical protein